MGKKRCHFPPEGVTIVNAITRKCKLGMLTYITMDISLCPLSGTNRPNLGSWLMHYYSQTAANLLFEHARVHARMLVWPLAMVLITRISVKGKP